MLAQARRPLSAATQRATRCATAVAPSLRRLHTRMGAGEQPPSEPAAAPAAATEQPPAPTAAAPAPAAAPPAAPTAAAGPRGPRGKKGNKQPRMASAGLATPQQAAPRPQRQIPIKGMVQPKQPRAGEVDWKEGELFPEGWEQMDLGQKAYQLYMGKRGALYWMTQAAWYSAIGLGVSWALFRFVGPALGLYTLKGDLMPTMM